jgi:hypothetical protein
MPDAKRPRSAAPLHLRDAGAAGVSRRQLAGPRWSRLFPDVYVRAGTTRDAHIWKSAAELAIAPDEIAWGPTAAWLHGVLAPDPRQPPTLHITTMDGRGHRRRVAGAARLRLDEVDVVQLRGVRATSPERTCFDIARTGSCVDAVIAVDAFLSATLTTSAQLWRFCQERRRWPGIDRLREAVTLGSDRVRSPAESRLRLLLVLNGLPEPLVNVTVHDDAGRRIGTPDLLYLSPVLGIEYDGSYHSAGDVHQIDLVRENGFATRGIPLLRYSAHDLRNRPMGVVAEVERALSRLR